MIKRCFAVAVASATVASLCLAAATPAAAARDSRPTHGEFTPVLAELAKDRVASTSDAAQAEAVSLPRRGPGSLLRQGDRVLVEIRFGSDPRAAVGELRSAGARVIHVSSHYETNTVAIPPERLDALRAVPGVENVSEILTPVVAGEGDPAGSGSDLNTCQGAKTSEGDTQLRAAGARAQWDADGAGVKVGVLSDSFARTIAPTSAAGDVATGDLPGPGNPCGRTTPVQLLDDPVTDGSDEGRGMAQIVHDLAPGSPLAFATAFTGELAFADNIRDLENDGADVIVDDVSYFSEPFFQDGPIAVAVNDVTADGAVYYSSAANNNIISGGQNVASFEAPAFRPSGGCPVATGMPPYATECMDFDVAAGVDGTYGITVPAGRSLTLDLQWAQPRFGVATDLDAYLLDASGALLDSSERVNVQGAAGSTELPFELITWENGTGTAQSVNLAINRYTGSGGGNTASPRLKFIFLQNGGQSVVPNEYTTSNGTDIVGPTIFGHNGAANAVSTAAVPFNNSNVVETFSSRGPLAHYFGPVQGATPAGPISPLQLDKPDLAATDGGQNTFFGGFDGFNYRFYGTSAAAPHAAAVAALMRELAPGATVTQIKAAQENTAAAVGAFPPTAAGAGLVDAVAATASLTRTLTVARAGSGAGTVTSAPAGISCGATCAAAFGLGETVTLTASPASGSTFEGWSGGGCTGTGTCQVTVGSDQTVTATFAVQGQPLPDTVIETGPTGAVSSTGATFSFRSTLAGSTFQCRLDGAGFSACSSPKGYANLTQGQHTFAVRALDAGSGADPSPATRSFFVDTRAPAIEGIVKRVKSAKRKAKFTWIASDPAPGTGIASQQCRLDNRRFAACGSPKTYKRLKAGRHRFTIRAVDRVGNASERSVRFKVKRRR